MPSICHLLLCISCSYDLWYDGGCEAVLRGRSMFARCQRILLRLALPLAAGLLLLLLGACSEIRIPAQIPPTPTPLVFTPFGVAVANGLPATGADVTTVGY